jgi:hypothetical protein
VTSIRSLTKEELDSFTYTMGELRYLAREHGVLLPRGVLHHEIVRALAAAGVGLPFRQAAQPLLVGVSAVTDPDVSDPDETPGLLAKIVQGYREHVAAEAEKPGDEDEVVKDDPACE